MYFVCVCVCVCLFDDSSERKIINKTSGKERLKLLDVFSACPQEGKSCLFNASMYS